MKIDTPYTSLKNFGVRFTLQKVEFEEEIIII